MDKFTAIELTCFSVGRLQIRAPLQWLLDVFNELATRRISASRTDSNSYFFGLDFEYDFQLSESSCGVGESICYSLLRTHMKTWIMTSHRAPMTKEFNQHLMYAPQKEKKELERYINSLTTHAHEVKDCIWILATRTPFPYQESSKINV
jgi:hypothetical protein